MSIVDEAVKKLGKKRAHHFTHVHTATPDQNASHAKVVNIFRETQKSHTGATSNRSRRNPARTLVAVVHDNLDDEVFFLCVFAANL